MCLKIGLTKCHVYFFLLFLNSNFNDFGSTTSYLRANFSFKSLLVFINPVNFESNWASWLCCCKSAKKYNVSFECLLKQFFKAFRPLIKYMMLLRVRSQSNNVNLLKTAQANLLYGALLQLRFVAPI